jgi:phage repressor protein C with HTH and peptisase S24 domain
MGQNSDPNLRFSDVIPEGEEADLWLPVLSLAAACGRIVDRMEVKEDNWVYVGQAYDDQHFVARAKGDSMAPKINDGDYCIFKVNPGGPYSGSGRIFLFQYQGEPDSETGGSFTIKGYRSHKGADGLNLRVELLPLNKAYSTREFKAEDGNIDQKLHFVAEFVEVIQLEDFRGRVT